MENFTKLDQPTGRSIYLDGKEYLFFGGTSYLGLATHSEYIELFIAGLRQYGVNNGTSRNNNVQQAIFDKAEQYAAQRFGFEAALLLSSGYLATQFVVKALSKEGELLYAPSCHPSLWLDANPNVADDYTAWSLQTVDYINQSEETSFVIVSNSLDNMKPERYDFSVFAGISATKKVVLLLDDSHGIGVLRENGISLAKRDFLGKNIELIVVASLAKGLATDAGLILAKDERIEQFRKSNFYSGASPSSPASLYAFVNAEKIYQKQFEKLQENIRYFSSLSKGYLNAIANFPVFSSNDISLYARLMEAGMLVSSFPYPLASDPLLNRIVINAHHTSEDLKRISHAIGIY
ncbi:MAG: aminotransferase class I/II-fold pyridoxal phosphate-dependent enzyme [Sphingobacterium sp.]|jgi:7-keto-8-aminopelargonate synthetase-like enzyme|nr:aminotransferase class I/II-fold pyridoxal phosphate-dependent enzyme [Sphingobacterium sp.]